MKNKKTIIIFTCITFIISGIVVFTLPSNKNKEVLKSKYININPDNEMISLMLETEMGSGKYEQSSSNAWPTSGYVFNEELSKCENGGELTYNETTKKVTLQNNISDRCYVYFDKPLPDVYIATTYNGASGSPTVVGATATLSCTGSDATYNQKYNRIEVSSINGKSAKCTLAYMDRTSKIYLNNKIISLVGTNQGDGQVVNEPNTDYRYEGKNPNNYIWFNNELWRIIGVFDTNTHNQSDNTSTTPKENMLVKIIRAYPIGGLAWNKSSTNDWTNSSLYKLLNPISGDSNSGVYYNKKNGNGNTYCYSHSTSAPGNCDYSNIGIDSKFKNMIKQVTWKLGGHSTTTANAATFYTAERGSTTGNSNAYANEVTGYIGLMYPSDYGYSALASSCARTINLSAYNKSSCMGQSWLSGKGSEWTLSPNSSDSRRIFYILDIGGLSNTYEYLGYVVRPSLYLDSSVYVIDGTGTESNPYIIGM